MPNEQNIAKHKYKAGDPRASANGRAGGIASGATKRKNRDIRVAINELLEKGYNIKDPDNPSKRKDVSGAEALALVIMNKALRGDTKAFELVRDTAGQKPTDSMILTASVNTPYDELTAEQLRELLKMHENGAI